jgi:hypothetical protein
MVLIVLGAWTFLAAVVAVGFAAMGRAGLQEEQDEARRMGPWLVTVADDGRTADDPCPARPLLAVSRPATDRFDGR